MKIPQQIRVLSRRYDESIYSKLSLLQLIDCIVDHGDRLALEEIHNRPLFSVNRNLYFPLVAYLDRQREFAAGILSNSRNAAQISEMAYDLTLLKFSELPNESNEKKGLKVERRGTNCRFYFNAIRNTINSSYQADPPGGELEREARAAKILQRYVNRHFRFSIYEALRKSDPFWSRYYWRINDMQICVRLPVFLKGRQRQEWLENNIDNPDPEKSGETKRIQEIINRNFVTEGFTSFDEDAVDDSLDPEAKFWSKVDEYHGITLSTMVAKEKAMNIHKQRPSIQKIGESQLKKMILKIFNELPNDDYKDVNIARSFGLSKATFSRFAGSKWNQNDSQIPDLWQNTAQILSKHTMFMELAEKVGIWEKVKSIAKKSTKRI